MRLGYFAPGRRDREFEQIVPSHEQAPAGRHLVEFGHAGLDDEIAKIGRLPPDQLPEFRLRMQMPGERAQLVDDLLVRLEARGVEAVAVEFREERFARAERREMAAH